MLSINAKVHNHFDFVVQDVQTGKVKQTARAYNIVLDTYFSYVLNSRNPLHSITLGIGTGEPATTDTALFSAIITKQATEVEKQIEYPTSYVKKKIVLEPTECVGQDITEVGFVGNYYYYGNRYDLVTHAMLKDAEGNQIVVHKTEEDIITVYATFYATIGTETGGKYLLPTAEKNTVLSNMLFGGGYAANYTLGMSPNIQTADDLELTNVLVTSTKSVNRAIDEENNQWIFPLTRWNYTEGNTHVISCIGAPNIAAWPLPNPDVMPNITLTDIQIANGDGETTEFSCPIPIVVKNSEVIRVNGVLMTSGNDYEFDYENNSSEYPELFVSADPFNYDISGGNGIVGNLNYRITYRFAAWDSRSGNSEAIDAEHPLVFDFRKRINVNRVILDAGALAGGTTIVGLEYSDDGEVWTEVCNSGEAKSAGYVAIDAFLDADISARFWRITSTGSVYNTKLASFKWGHVSPGIKFKTAPADGAAITMNCDIDRPLKNENWMLDFTFAVKFARG